MTLKSNEAQGNAEQLTVLDQPKWAVWRQKGYAQLWMAAYLVHDIEPSNKNVQALESSFADIDALVRATRSALSTNYGHHSLLPRIKHAMEGKRLRQKVVKLGDLCHFLDAMSQQDKEAWGDVTAVLQGLNYKVAADVDAKPLNLQDNELNEAEPKGQNSTTLPSQDDDTDDDWGDVGGGIRREVSAEFALGGVLDVLFNKSENEYGEFHARLLRKEKLSESAIASAIVKRVIGALDEYNNRITPSRNEAVRKMFREARESFQRKIDDAEKRRKK